MVNERQERPASYRAEDIEVWSRPKHIRQRPCMYIGDVGQGGLHFVANLLAANALAETTAGHGRSLAVTLGADGSLAVADEGRGIAHVLHPTFGRSLLEVVLTAGFLPGPISPGRDWLAYAVVNALSEWLTVETRHDGQVFQQDYRGGEPVTAARRIGACCGSGLAVRFKPDPSIFTDPRFSFDVLRDRLRQNAFLHSGVQVSLADEASGAREWFEFEDGIRAFVQALNQGRRVLHPEVFVTRGERAGVRYEAGLQWCRIRDEVLLSFVNDEQTTLGGTHVTGLRDAVTRTLNSFVRAAGRIEVRALKGEEVRRGLTAVVSVRMARAAFGGATKERLVSDEAQRAVAAGVGPDLRRFFEANPAAAEAVVLAATREADDV